MLTLLAKHSLCDLTIKATGDLDVDAHHTVEDVGIALGQAFVQALGDKRGIRRYGWALVPMDESLAQARIALDFSNRPYPGLRWQELEPASPMSTLGRKNDFASAWCGNFCRASPTKRGAICTSMCSAATNRTTSSKPSSKPWPRPSIKPANATRA